MPFEPGGKRQQTTLSQIAEAAKVSMATVSNVVHGRFHMMSAETKARVESTIKVLGYRPHISARGLRSAQSFLIGMLVVDESLDFMDGYTTQTIAGLSNYLGTRGYGLTLHGVRPGEFEKSIFISDARTDGLCVFLSGTARQRADMVDRLSVVNEPIVLLQEKANRPLKDVCVICQDDVAGGSLIANHLIDLGAKTFLILKPKVEWSAVHRRVLGIRSVLRSKLASENLTILSCDHMDFTKTQNVFAKHLAAAGLPDAIVALNDNMGIAAMKYLLERSIKIPEQVLLTGFNGFNFWRYSSPVLTTVHSPAYELGTRAATEMIKRLERGKFSTQSILLSVKLKIGNTTDRKLKPKAQ